MSIMPNEINQARGIIEIIKLTHISIHSVPYFIQYFHILYGMSNYVNISQMHK